MSINKIPVNRRSIDELKTTEVTSHQLQMFQLKLQQAIDNRPDPGNKALGWMFISWCIPLSISLLLNPQADPMVQGIFYSAIVLLVIFGSLYIYTHNSKSKNYQDSLKQLQSDFEALKNG